MTVKWNICVTVSCIRIIAIYLTVYSLYLVLLGVSYLILVRTRSKSSCERVHQIGGGGVNKGFRVKHT